MPLFFLSGALFPLTNAGIPEWLRIASNANPLTYGVDALRTVILGEAWQPLYALPVNLAVLGAFDIIMIAIGTWAFTRMK